MRRERGTVVEVRGGIAIVRLAPTDACSACAAAGRCRSAAGGGERLLEARNEAGAVAGAVVEVAVDPGPGMRRRVRSWLLPLLGLLVGAALAQALAAQLADAGTAGRAAGIGGMIGAAIGAGLAAARRQGAAAPPVLVRILEPGDGAPR